MNRVVLTCECGYEKVLMGRVTDPTVACDNCGAELDVNKPADASAASTGSESGSALAPNSAPAPSPFEDPEEPFAPVERIPFEVQETVDPKPAAGMRAESTASGADTVPRSPFEKWETVDKKPAAGIRAESTASAADTAPRSPFEDSETVPEPSIPSPVEEKKSGTRDWSPATAIPGYFCCARCGREFRGDWDEVKADEGTICYNCWNDGSTGTPERLKEQEATAREFPQKLRKRVPEEDEESRYFLGFDTQSRSFQGALILFAMMIILVTVYFGMTGDITTPVPAPAPPEETSRDFEDPEFLGPLLIIWSFVSLYLAGFIAIYIVLRTTEKLPHDELFRDLIFIGVVTFGITLLHMGLSFVGILIAGLVLYRYFNMRLYEIIVTFIVYKLIAFALDGVWMFVLWGLYELLQAGR